MILNLHDMDSQNWSMQVRFVLVGILVLSAECFSQIVPFDSARWEIQAKEWKVIDHLGRRSLYLKGGMAEVKDSWFVDGFIEFDIAASSEFGFMGVVWRVQDSKNFEEFYIRPHLSGNPDATQYQPVFNGVAAWQLYHGGGYSAAVKYDIDKWMHVKIVVSGKYAEVYIQNMDAPILFINDLKRGVKPGKVGLNVSNFAPAYFSNFSFTAISNPLLKGDPKEEEIAPNGTIMSWMVSDLFEGKSLEQKYQLTQDDAEQRIWRQLECENTGLANLARLQGLDGERNTVFARVVIVSEVEQFKKVRFGFSDNVKVYFNGQLMYGGSDIFRSRDYRFLGSIGLFDELYLPLKRGENELWFAVTENFGGWGIEAFVDDMTEIKIKD